MGKKIEAPDGMKWCTACSDFHSINDFSPATYPYRSSICRTQRNLVLKRTREYKYKARSPLNTTRNCPECGISFRLGFSSIQKYCSRKCGQVAGEKRRWPRKDKEYCCAMCGAPFVSNKPWSKFCSRSCKWRAKSQRSLKGRKPEAIHRGACQQCGAEFSQKLRHYKHRKPKFCSMECAYKSRQRGDVVNRGREWPTVAASIRERDGNKCVICNSTHSARGKKKLPVDHIIPFRLMLQWQMMPNDGINLLTLCTPHHTIKTRAEDFLLKGDVRRFIDRLNAMNYPGLALKMALANAGLSTQGVAL